MEQLLHDIHRAHREITETRLLLFTLCAAPILEIPLIMAALDTLDAANTSLDESIAALPGAVTASNAAAVAAAEASFQTAADATAAKAAALAAEIGNLTNGGSTTPTPTPTPTITVNPATVSFAVGVPSSVALTIAGGTSPYTASGEPTGVTFDGTSLNGDDTTVAGNTEVTISDSSTPALTASVDVVVA